MCFFFGSVLGMHSNMCAVLSPWTFFKIGIYGLVPFSLPEDDRQKMYPLSRILSQWLEETGYLHEQATKPDSIGIKTFHFIIIPKRNLTKQNVCL